ncbi:MAG: hypothetical protein ACM3KL_06940 [Alphaproteobacteria bacterium]
MRALGISLLPFVLTSCLTALLGDPVASTEYVVTSGTELQLGQIVREVGESNGLRFFRWRDAKPHYPYREYTNWAPGGAVSTYLTLDTRPPFLITISDQYIAYRTALHRKIARDLETRLTQVGIAFHKPTADEFIKLKDERFKKET